MSKTKFFPMFLSVIVPAICIAGTIYEDARNYAIDLYHKGKYREAATQFVATQNIAPVNNDLTQWLSKCNSKIALLNNKKTVNKKPCPVKQHRSQRNVTTNQETISQDDFVVYDSIGRYNNDGIALAVLNGKFGYVNRAKKIVVPLKYDNVDIFGKPAVISIGDFYRSVLSDKGDWNGIAMSVQREGKWGFVDKNGVEIIPCKYDLVENFLSKKDSITPVAIGDKFGYVNMKGDITIAFDYEFAGRFSSKGLAPVVKNNKLGFINYKGETLIDFIYDPKYEINDGKVRIKDSFWLNDTIAICKNGKWGLINDKGVEVFPFIFDNYVNWNLEGTGYQNMHTFTFVKESKECYLFNGKVYYNIENLEEAKLVFKAKFNDPKFIFDLAAYYWNKGEYNPSSVWAEKGDKLNHAGCSRLLGAYWLFYTDTPSMAYYFLKKAADQEDDIAQYFLGLMYENDLVSNNGKKKDKYRNVFNMINAKEWYEKSAKHGNKQAIEKLKSF